MNRDKIAQYLGNQIKNRRKDKGLRQGQLAELIGLSRASIINLETGRHMPTIEGLMSLCGFLQCTPNDLLPPPTLKNFHFETKTIKVLKQVQVIKVTNNQ
jgi:transcriptional regulator with XRE-family HTH domain